MVEDFELDWEYVGLKALAFQDLAGIVVGLVIAVDMVDREDELLTAVVEPDAAR